VERHREQRAGLDPVDRAVSLNVAYTVMIYGQMDFFRPSLMGEF